MATRNSKIPIVQNGILRRFDGGVICRIGPRTGWLDWLQRPTTKSFHYTAASGAHCTVCKEKRTGNGGEYFYFIAYRSIGNKKYRRLIGRAEDVTLRALEKAAGELAQLEAGGPQPGRGAERKRVEPEEMRQLGF